MLYLIESKAIDSVVAGPPEQVITFIENVTMPSFKMLVEGERSKKFTGGIIAGRRAWAIIADFPNHEEANKWVMGLPFWGTQIVEITPLIPFQSQMDSVNKMVQDLKSRQKK
jgi:hypothetical protein